MAGGCMNIVYTDDKKEKYQSVRATVTLENMNLMGHVELYAEGLGSTEEEAKKELMYVMKHIVDKADFWLKTQEPTRRAGPPHGEEPLTYPPCDNGFDDE
jgi:hypothetical protein